MSQGINKLLLLLLMKRKLLVKRNKLQIQHLLQLEFMLWFDIKDKLKRSEISPFNAVTFLMKIYTLMFLNDIITVIISLIRSTINFYSVETVLHSRCNAGSLCRIN